MLERITIVLSHTSHPGNIGAAARAMKTMGLSRLVLVNPQRYPSAEATARASGANDVLAAARVCQSVAEAVSECRLVLGTSARLRRVSLPQTDARDAALSAQRADAEVAVVFGREKSGLTNDEIALCHSLLNIPSNPEYPSLNLGAAVQLVSYELRMAALAAGNQQAPRMAPHEPASAGQILGLAEHFESMLGDIGYLENRQTKTLKARLRRFWNRAEPGEDEINLFRGIFSAVQRLAGGQRH